jgi:hypothetical protein
MEKYLFPRWMKLFAFAPVKLVLKQSRFFF